MVLVPAPVFSPEGGNRGSYCPDAEQDPQGTEFGGVLQRSLLAVLELGAQLATLCNE